MKFELARGRNSFTRSGHRMIYFLLLKKISLMAFSFSLRRKKKNRYCQFVKSKFQKVNLKECPMINMTKSWYWWVWNDLPFAWWEIKRYFPPRGQLFNKHLAVEKHMIYPNINSKKASNLEVDAIKWHFSFANCKPFTFEGVVVFKNYSIFILLIVWGKLD